jgi:hypothetical protein
MFKSGKAALHKIAQQPYCVKRKKSCNHCNYMLFNFHIEIIREPDEMVKPLKDREIIAHRSERAGI